MGAPLEKLMRPRRHQETGRLHAKAPAVEQKNRSYTAALSSLRRAPRGCRQRALMVCGNVRAMFKTGLTVLLVAGLSLAGCGQSEQAPLPIGDQPATFVGSPACQGCHEAQYGDWLGSHHQQAMQVASAETVLGDFDNASLEYFGATTRFFVRDGGYYVETADGSGQDREFRIAYTFGVEPLQQYLVEFPGGRLQTLAFSWDTRPVAAGGQRWFHVYGDDYIAPDDELHWTRREQNWNYMCAECHSTNVDMGFDADSDSFATTYSEISVGCEACHGPGSKHIARAGAEYATGGSGLQVDLDDHARASWVMNPQTGIAALSETGTKIQQQPETCGRCHARRGIITAEYEYGEPLADTHMPALLDESLYFADGQILDEVYVYGSFLQSRMYRAGVTCSDCHNPHSNKLVTGVDPNAVCAQCHAVSRFSVIEHAGHEADQAGCVDCHMTSRTYMVVDNRRDHSFRVPRPDLTSAIGTPNACSGCHGDQDNDWATAAISGWRGSEAAPRPEFGTALDAGRHGFANPELLQVINDGAYPGIARATALSLLAQPFGSQDIRTLGTQLGSPDPLLRIAALRQLRALPTQLRLRLPGAGLLADPVRGVRIEAAVSYAGMQDLLPVEDARAYGQAERDFRDAYGNIANRPEALLALATFEMAEGNVPAAIARYEQALHIEPRAATARANLADALRGLNQEARAEAVLRDGLALDDTNGSLHHALGLSLIRSGRRPDALEELRRAAQLEPDNARFAYVFAIALNSMDQRAGALEVLRDAHERFDADFEVAMALATILRDSGDSQGALNIAYALARRHPEQPDVLALLRSLGAAP